MVIRRAGFPRVEVAEGKKVGLHVVVAAENTPIKKMGDLLVAYPTWQYRGPARTFTITFQVGYWRPIVGIWDFDGYTEIVSETFEQQASADWATFHAPEDKPFKGVRLTGLAVTPDNRYDMNIWFKLPGLEGDWGFIITDCCQVLAVIPEIKMVSCRFM